MKKKLMISALMTFALLALAVAPAFGCDIGHCFLNKGKCICDYPPTGTVAARIDPVAVAAAVALEAERTEATRTVYPVVQPKDGAGFSVSLSLVRASAAEKLAGPLGLPKSGNYQKCYLVGGFCGKLCCDTNPKIGCGCYDLARSTNTQ